MKKEIKKEMFSLVLEFNGKEKTYKANSIVGCLESIEKPLAYKTKGIFNIKFGKKKARLLLNPLQIRRLLVNSLSKQIFAKRLISILK